MWRCWLLLLFIMIHSFIYICYQKCLPLCVLVDFCLFILSACLISLPFFLFVDVQCLNAPKDENDSSHSFYKPYLSDFIFSLDSFDECVYVIWVVYGCCCFESFTFSIHSMVWMVQAICPHVHVFARYKMILWLLVSNFNESEWKCSIILG